MDTFDRVKLRTDNRGYFRVFAILTLLFVSSSLPFARADNPDAKAHDSSEFYDDLRGMRVALLEWPGAILPAMKKMFEWMNCTVMMVSAKDIKNGCLDNFDVLACPGGSGSPLGELGLEGKLKIQDFISGGGGYIGICAGALYACDYFVWIGVPSFEPPFNQNVVMGEELSLDLFPGVGYFPIEEISVHTAMTKINIIDHTHPISDSLPDHMQIFYAQGPYLQPYEDANITILGTYDVTGKPAIVAFQYGRGRVFLSGSHPEFEMDSDRDGFPPDPEFSDEGSDWPLVLEAMKWFPPKAGVKIYGKDNKGRPVSGASVTSTSQPEGQEALNGTTGVDGSVTFTDVRPGNYTIQVSKSGYTTDTGTVNAVLKETAELTILLEKEAKGIPGFPYESIIIGITVGILLLWWVRARIY